jgi:hypothetical protein
MEQALARLRKEYASAGKAELFEELGEFLSREAGPGDYQAAAKTLGMSASAMAVAVHRLRQRYRECVRLELSETVTNAEQLEGEMKHLFAALTG